MNGKDDILIDRFLAGEASVDEVREVEVRRSTDPEFRKKIAEAELAVEALRVHHLSLLRDRLASRNVNLIDQNPGTKRSRWILGILLLGLILLVCLTLIFFPEKKSSSSRSPKEHQDSTVQHQVTPLDTSIQTLDPPTPVQQEKNQSPDMAELKKKGEELYAEYFTPYVDELMNPAMRGEEVSSPTERFQKHYWEGQYRDAVQAFEHVPKSPSPSDNTLFMYANALMATGSASKALPVLESIVRNNKSRYSTESLLMLALGHLNRGEINNASGYLDKYLGHGNAKRKEDALKIKQELNNLQR